MLRNKKIALGICGGIAAYKCAHLVRLLVKEGDQVRRSQLLIELQSSPLAAEAARARAEVEAAESELEQVTRGGSAAELHEAEQKLREARAAREEADAALYEAKQAGRDRVIVAAAGERDPLEAT